MRRLFTPLIVVLFLFVTPVSVLAQETYTTEQVSEHATVEDCWTILDDKVYDITEYLSQHDESFMNIDEWCGTDMTSDFKSKAGAGRDHTGGYRVIESYEIGEIAAETTGLQLNLEVALVTIGIAVAIGLAAWLVSKRG